MTYAEKLKDPRWQKKRLQILSRDEFRCQDCFETTKTLHVHHRDYIKNTEPWDHPDEYLVTLCEDCHVRVEEDRAAFENDIITNFRLKILSHFNQSVTAEVFVRYKQLEILFYMLWELQDNEADVIEVVRWLSNKIMDAKREEYSKNNKSTPQA